MAPYLEHPPSSYLKPIIDTYWVSHSRQATWSKIVPDGFVDIVINLERNAPIPIRISGMMTKYREVLSHKDSTTLGIRIKPGAFPVFSNLPLSNVKNSTIEASLVLPWCNMELVEHLVMAKNNNQYIRIIEDCLKPVISSCHTKDNLTSTVCKHIQRDYQQLDLVELHRLCNMSLRQLERKFKASVGLTMKEYQSVIRFKNTWQDIQQKNDKSLLLTAFDNGYYDHAHLTKDFGLKAGVNPSHI
ncbi:helix-turn-helix domain-containing protein [uncultured Zobellia sp.]|uniref:helix-turn-helix domain-containing protein n=1 Tax=uncultured Zobellia sp. TaxID=255433 RepID=UPI002599B596|nr:helix-turn-helix domain-containing protein [uncultured Zobellia sp.]